jgi:hypothetical protein
LSLRVYQSIEAAAALGLEIEARAILPDATSLPPVVDALRDLPAIHHLEDLVGGVSGIEV